MKEWTEAEKAQLEGNSNVKKVTDKSVAYTAEFKIKAVASFECGESADDFFSRAGIPLELFPQDYARACVKRWRIKRDAGGDAAFREETRGKGSRGRPKKEGLDGYSVDELKAIINFQADFIEELKKLKALAQKKSRKD